MKSIDELVAALTRPGVTEVAIASGRAPVAKVGGIYRPLSQAQLSSDDVMRLLAVAEAPAGETFEAKPVQWSTHAGGAGTLAIVAFKKGGLIQAKVALSSAAPPSAPGASPIAPQASPVPASRPPPPAATPSRPSPSPGPARPSPTAAPAAAAPAAVAPAARPGVAVHASHRGDIDSLLAMTRAERASDLHLVAGRPPLLRKVGELVPAGDVLPPERVEQLGRSMVPPRLLSVLEADGSADFSLASPAHGRFRVNVSRQRTGLKVCIRAIGQTTPTLASLGLPEAIAKATHHHQGMIVLSGPSGHGKTSTLAAIVDIINRETTHHVITVEDPIEYVHERKKALMSQREVGTHTKTFAAALKGSLREDPDVIVVGELRDTETVRMAMSASETGHLVLATMNTPSAAKTIDRLIDLFPPAEQAQVRISLSVGLRMVVNQRLLPSADKSALVAAAEVLPGSVALGNLIREEKTFQIPSLQQRGKSIGIIRFEDALAELIHQGRISMEVAREYSDTPDELPGLVNALRAPPPAADPRKGDPGLLSRMGMARKGG